MVVVPYFVAMAMENWGLIVYLEQAMLYDPDTHSEHRKEQVAKIVSHEIAHQVKNKIISLIVKTFLKQCQNDHSWGKNMVVLL